MMEFANAGDRVKKEVRCRQNVKRLFGKKEQAEIEPLTGCPSNTTFLVAPPWYYPLTTLLFSEPT